MPGPLDFLAGLPQAGRIGDFHGPAVHGGLHADDVAGGARRAVNDRPLVTGNRIDQAALAHVGSPGHDDLPRPDEVQTGGGVGQEGLDLLPGRFFAPACREDSICSMALSQRASILVEENCRRARGAGFRQGQSGGGGERVGLLAGRSTLARRFAGNRSLTRISSMRATAASPPWQWSSIAAIGMPVDHDFLAAGTKLADNDPSRREIGQRPAAAGDEVPGNRVQGPGAFDAEACHGPAARRGELDQQQRGSVGHGQRRVRSGESRVHLFAVLVGLHCD